MTPRRGVAGICDIAKLFEFLDYIGGYLMLKTARTIVCSTLALLVILLVRKILDHRSGSGNPALILHIKAYLWLMMLPVPLMGGLRLIPGRFYIRNLLYVFMYENIMTYRIIGRLYFLGMALTAAVFIFRRGRLRRWVRRLPVCEDRSVCDKRFGMPGVQIRTTALSVTPFTIGIWKPIIVLPDYIIQSFDEQELDAVLRHEWRHIKRGHLLIYGVLGLFRIFWFANPLVHFCARKVRDDLEMLCDYAVIDGGNYCPEHYAMTLLKTITCCGKNGMERKSHVGVPAFLGESPFSVMKKRVAMIAAYGECPRRRVRCIYAGFGLLLCLLFVFVKLASYPAYTPDSGYSLYSMDGKRAVLYENEAFNEAVKAGDSGLLVNNRRVKELLRSNGECEYDGEYWIYYGGFIKLPGTGGGGDLLYYPIAETDGEMTLIPYNKRDMLTKFIDWAWKHM